ERAAPDVEHDGVPGPEGRRHPADRARPDGDTDRRQPAGREGRGRDRDDRVDARGRERGDGRARDARHPARGHAAHAGTGLARDAGGGGLIGGAITTKRPAEFDYRRPTSVEEARGLLATDDDARALAGGHSLLPMIKLRLAEPGTIVAIGRSPGLDGFDQDGD